MKPFNRILILLISFIGLSNNAAQAQCSPTLKEIYDFEVGDQFFYRETYQQDDVGRSYYTYRYEDYKITDKISNGDTLQFIRLSNTNSIDTLFFIDSANHALNRCFYIPDTTLPICGSYRSTGREYIRIYNTIDPSNRKYKLFGTRYFSEIYFPDSLGYYDFELDEFKSLSHECYSIYREGIGLYAEGSYIFETNHFYELQKFIRGTDTLHITLSETHDDLLTHSIKIYPNPVQYSCQIECPYTIQEILVNDVSGRIQNLEVEVQTQSEWTLNTSELIPGVYYLTIKTEKGNVIKKLLKY